MSSQVSRCLRLCFPLISANFQGHGWDVKCAQWHPTKGLIVSGSKDNLIKFWDPRTGTCLSTLSVSFRAANFSCRPDHLDQTSSQKYNPSSIMVPKWQPCGQCIARSKRPCIRHPRHERISRIEGAQKGSLLYVTWTCLLTSLLS